jgi:hypothetical protein
MSWASSTRRRKRSSFEEDDPTRKIVMTALGENKTN